MNYRHITLAVLVAVIVILLVWEGVVLAKNDPNASTISEVLQSAFYRYPVLALLLGILIGHWLWAIVPPVHTPTVIEAPKEQK